MTVDGLTDSGLVRMNDDQIRGFLSSQRVGVLGLPAEGPPTLRPLSFWFDGESRIYFLYVFASGERSRKEALSERAGRARFLVYRVDTPFQWTSVLLTGTIDEVLGDERDAVRDAMDMQWRPDLFERHSLSDSTELYRFEIEELVGIKQADLPPEFEADTGADRTK